MKYKVIITRYHHYEIEADSDVEAEEKGVKEFECEMSRPIASTHYDEIEVEEVEEDEE